MTKRGMARTGSWVLVLASLLGGAPGCVMGNEALDLTGPIPDEAITNAEAEQGEQALVRSSLGGEPSPVIDQVPPSYATDGDPELTPEPLPPSAAELEADAVTMASALDDVVTPVLDEPLLESPELITVALAETARSHCRSATGYVSGRPFQLCVTTIDGHLVGRRTARAYERMEAAARRDGVHLSIVSGFRTMHQQRVLYRLYLEGRGNLAARPGYSNHQSGIALDLNTSAPGVYSWLAHHAHHWGFRRTVPSEAWHWEYRP